MSNIVFFGEILLRLAAPASRLILQERQLEASFCGAEANAAVALAGFGHDCRMVTVVPDNELGKAALAELRKFGVAVDSAVRPDGRMGLYFLASGAMARPARILYDRAGSSFAGLEPQWIEWDRALDGADWLFASGISAALGDGPLTALREAFACARAKGVRIAFDSNYRPALWRGREALAASVLYDLAGQADLLFAGRRAVGMMVGRDFAKDDADAGFANAVRAIFDRSAALSHVAATRRVVLSSDRHRMTALLASREECAVTATIDLDRIVDRIGTGDAFAAGILHGLVTGMPIRDCADFALACSQWSHSIEGDFLRASLEDITSLMEGGGDVRR